MSESGMMRTGSRAWRTMTMPTRWNRDVSKEDSAGETCPLSSSSP